MRSKPIGKASGGLVVPGTIVWFSTLKGQVPGLTGCAVLGGARFVREEGPLVPGSLHGEARWRDLEHTVDDGTMKVWVQGMSPGYKKAVWAWHFEDAFELPVPVQMADSSAMTFVPFQPRTVPHP